MTDDPRTLNALLEVKGQAADHLYREGSAKASFWEAVFGSSLRAKNRTYIFALPDGTRMFDVPLLALEGDLLRRAHDWMTSEASGGACREAASLLAGKRVRVRLIGLQPRGQAVATFSLRFEPSEPAAGRATEAAGAFGSWFEAEGELIATQALVPFGFTPQRG